jgi:esterase
MKLNYKKIGDGNKHLIILHGLLGSLDNWQSIAKQLSNSYSIYIIDQRNHGRSPHTPEINYNILAEDVVSFMQEHCISKATLLGHSMGGKVAMEFALHYPNLMNTLIVIDIAPKKYVGGHEHILNAMQAAPISQTDDRKTIEHNLETKIINVAERQFILKNLSRNNEGKFYWKCNLQSLIQHYNILMDFPTHKNTFMGNTFFIKGENSNYILESDQNKCKALFPNAQFVTIKNAAHWVHAENPEAFIIEINKIL